MWGWKSGSGMRRPGGPEQDGGVCTEKAWNVIERKGSVSSGQRCGL